MVSPKSTSGFHFTDYLHNIHKYRVVYLPSKFTLLNQALYLYSADWRLPF